MAVLTVSPTCALLGIMGRAPLGVGLLPWAQRHQVGLGLLLARTRRRRTQPSAGRDCKMFDSA